MRLAAALALVSLTFIGCETIQPECRTEYADTLMHCGERPRPAPRDCAPVYVDGEYRGCVDRWEIMRGVDQLLRYVHD